jgi:hypothetical protein
MWASGHNGDLRRAAHRLRAKHVFRPTMRDWVSSEGLPIQVVRLRAVRLVTGVLLDLTIEWPTAEQTMEHGHAGGNLHASVGSGSAGGKGSGSHQSGSRFVPITLPAVKT